MRDSSWPKRLVALALCIHAVGLSNLTYAQCRKVAKDEYAHGSHEIILENGKIRKRIF